LTQMVLGFRPFAGSGKNWTLDWPIPPGESSLMRKPAHTPYDDAFFNNQEQGSAQSARVIVPIVVRLLNPKSVIDIGCGRGTWLFAFQENGVKTIKGLDGQWVDTSRMLVDPACFTPTDLSRPFQITGSYDLAVCLEVGEHIPQRHSRQLVHALTAASPIILWSAALPGQGGVNHINEQWPSYWQSLFAERGYRRLDPIRRLVWQDERVAWWYRQNILVYAAEATIAKSDELSKELELSRTRRIELIDISVLGQFMYIKGLILALRRTLLRSIKRRFL